MREVATQVRQERERRRERDRSLREAFLCMMEPTKMAEAIYDHLMILVHEAAQDGQFQISNYALPSNKKMKKVVVLVGTRLKSDGLHASSRIGHFEGHMDTSVNEEIFLNINW